MFGKNISILSKLTLYNRVREALLVNFGTGGSGGFTIPTFTVSQTEAEVGEIIANLTLNWTYSPLGTDPDSQTINQGVGAIGVTLRTANTGAVDTTIGSSKTWNLNAVFPTNSPSVATTINFRRRRYWGVSTNPDIGNSAINLETPATPEDSIVAAFSNELATGRQTSKVFDCTGGRYIYHLWPASFSINTPQWRVNTFPVQLDNANVRLVNLTNIHGNTVQYYITRSDNLLNGSSITVEVL